MWYPFMQKVVIEPKFTKSQKEQAREINKLVDDRDKPGTSKYDADKYKHIIYGMRERLTDSVYPDNKEGWGQLKYK